MLSHRQKEKQTFTEIEQTITRQYILVNEYPTIQFQTSKSSITIPTTEQFGKMLYMDGVLQLAEKDEYMYHEMLVHPAMRSSMNPPKHVCILGGGDGCAAREVLKYSSVVSVDVVDWDTDFTNYTKEHCHSWNHGSLIDPRLTVHNINACFFNSSLKYDVILVDLFDPLYNDFLIDKQWDTLFYKIKALRAPGGSVVINGGGILPWKQLTFERLYQKMSLLRSKQMTPYKVFVPSFAEEWGFLLLHDFDVEYQFVPSFFSVLASFTNKFHEDMLTDIKMRYYSKETFVHACHWQKPYINFALPSLLENPLSSL